MSNHVRDGFSRKSTSSFRPLTKCEVKSLVATGLQRRVGQTSLEHVAEELDCTTTTVRRALAHESLLEADKLGNLLARDPSALHEWFSRLRLKVDYEDTEMSPDMLTASQMSRAVATFCEILEDGHRNHQETLQLAQVLRPLIPRLSAIIHEADGLKAVA